MPGDRREAVESSARPKVCGVLVSFRPGESGFREVLCSALAQLDGLIVVDNSPQPDAQVSVASIVETLARDSSVPTAVVLTAGENLGLSRAINRGIRQAISDGFSLVLLLDQDSVLGDGAVAALRAEHDRKAGAESGVLLAAENEVPNASTLQRLLDSVFYRYRGKGTAPRQSPMAITSGLLVEERVVRRVGLFDESMFLDSADHEFCLRARSAGVAIYTVPLARVRHELGESTGQRSALLGAELRYQNEEQLYYGTRDTLRTARRYGNRHPILATVLVGFTIARSTAYRWAGPNYRRQYRAARKGWVDFWTTPDRADVPSLLSQDDSTETTLPVGP